MTVDQTCELLFSIVTVTIMFLLTVLFAYLQISGAIERRKWAERKYQDGRDG